MLQAFIADFYIFYLNVMYTLHEQPALPLDVDPREPEYMESERHYIIPEGVRPILRTFRIEVQQPRYKKTRKDH